MSDYNNNNDDDKSSFTFKRSNSDDTSRSYIDVTKPRNSRDANIDESSVSSYTQRERESLERLAGKLGASTTAKDSKAPLIKTIVAVSLVVILVVLAIVFIILIGDKTKSQEENYDARVSMQIENKSSLIILTDSGKEKFKEIAPGDQVPLSAYVRNSNKYAGDIVGGESATPPNIYVRFKLTFILDYEVKNEKIKPIMNDKWYRYNKEDEDKFGEAGAPSDDGYYYYLGSLSFMQRAELFSAVEFVGDNIFCEDGGKYGQIQVEVESVVASLNNLNDGVVWPTAPKSWIRNMQLGVGNN